MLPGEFANVIEEDREKELVAALSIYHPVAFNWDPLFVGKPTPIAPDYPVSFVHKAVSSALSSCKEKLASTTLYPDFSEKTIGDIGRVTMNKIRESGFDVEINPSTCGLERLYSRTGIKIGGCTEMRTSFGLGDLRPRSYYARGPDVYYSSRYVQPIFNILIDSLPVTNRYHRFITAQLAPMDPSETLFIYDYSSFTSNLFEIRNFTAALGRYFHDTDVTIIDTFEGPISVNLGRLLLDFNEHCNVFPEFTVRDFGSSHSVGKDSNFHSCGMLGVPGNISSCTFLHGIHLAILLCSLSCRCIGDDAIGKERLERVVLLIERFLGNIGPISFKKKTQWESSAEHEDLVAPSSWHYTKRPISRSVSRVIIGTQAVVPPIVYVMNWRDPLRTTIWPETNSLYLKRCSRYITRFAVSLKNINLSEPAREFAEAYVAFWSQEMYRTYCDIRKRCPRFDTPFKKSQVRRVGVDAVEDIWLERYGKGGGYLKKRAFSYSEDEVVVREYPYSGYLTQPLFLASQLGYAETEEEQVFYSDPSTYADEYLASFEDHTIRYSYTWTLSSSCPTWLVTLVQFSLSDSLPEPIDSFGDSESDNEM
jgi:hypothetical protein